MIVVWIGLAGAFGALLRFSISYVRGGINIANVLGSFSVGIVTAHVSGDARTIVITGFLGGFTTFSTAMHQTFDVSIVSRRRAGVNAIVPVLISVIAVAIGYDI